MLFFARQPIFTARGNLYGYELLFRDQFNLTAANIRNQSQATSEIIVDGIAFASSHTAPHAKVFINIPDDLLRTGIPESISPGRCVLEILETVPCTRENVEVLLHLKSQGYTLALDDYTGQPDMEGFVEIADIVKVDLRSASAEQLSQVSRALRHRGVTMLAEKVESSEEAHWARENGYELLQGFYFQRPELISAKRLAPDAHTKLRVLCYLMSGNVKLQKLQMLLSHSPQLALRLLNFANSVAFSVTTRIDSIKQAIAFIGLDRLCRWLAAMLIADQFHTSDTARELTTICIFRAHFLRNTAAFIGRPYAEQLFALGLFSTLDAMYHMSFEDLLARTSLSEDVRNALTRKEGCFYPWLNAVLCLEAGNVDEARRIFGGLGVQHMGDVVKIYRAAMTLATNLHLDDKADDAHYFSN